MIDLKKEYQKYAKACGIWGSPISDDWKNIHYDSFMAGAMAAAASLDPRGNGLNGSEWIARIMELNKACISHLRDLDQDIVSNSISRVMAEITQPNDE